MTLAPALFCAPVAGLVPIDVDSANAILERWGHDLGPCRRPFGLEAWALDVDGVPVSVAVSASTVSVTVPDPDRASPRVWLRSEIVELARLCSDPEHAWATRPMLRLWREIAAPRWSYWPAKAAVSYSTRRHTGDLYRWDGWRLAGERSGSTGGGTWSTPRDADHPGAGRKRLWVWEWPEPSHGPGQG